MKINELFTPSYGTKLDLNKMTIVDDSDEKGINFVSRSSKNLGIVAKIKKLSAKEPYPAGLITVTLGGTYLLSSFIQPEPFYTAQNIVVLTPKREMTFQEKVFYCMCIAKNRFRYTSHGREANRTIKELELPNKIPSWVNKIPIEEPITVKPFHKNTVKLSSRNWLSFRYDDEHLFKIVKGVGARRKDMIKKGKTPFITSIDSNNGLTGMVEKTPTHNGNVIGVNRNGSVGEAFYQPKPFCSTEDVHIFIPKFELNQYIAMFLITLIRKQIFRYSFGRKWGLKRMNESTMMLPVDKKNNPDWKFMEDYIKSLSYSGNLQN